MAEYHRAILELNPDAKFIIRGDGEELLDTMEWLEGTTPIAKVDIIAKEAVIQTRDAHQRKRRLKYPTVEEQMDMLYKDEINGTTTWKDAIAAVKAAYPKAE